MMDNITTIIIYERKEDSLIEDYINIMRLVLRWGIKPVIIYTNKRNIDDLREKAYKINGGSDGKIFGLAVLDHNNLDNRTFIIRTTKNREDL